MKAPNTRFFAFVARFVDAVSTEALTTELQAQRQARMLARHEANLAVSAPRKAA